MIWVYILLTLCVGVACGIIFGFSVQEEKRNFAARRYLEALNNYDQKQKRSNDKQ